uniref:Uncharacterized protein n=1 Tax=Ciona intestinalis TaxID=7719 RepID=H2XUU9_CIOIN
MHGYIISCYSFISVQYVNAKNLCSIFILYIQSNFYTFKLQKYILYIFPKNQQYPRLKNSNIYYTCHKFLTETLILV